MQCLNLGVMVEGGLNFDGALNFLLYHNFWLNDFIPVSVLQGWRYIGSVTPLSSTAAAHQNSTASDLPLSPADSLNASHTWRKTDQTGGWVRELTDCSPKRELQGETHRPSRTHQPQYGSFTARQEVQSVCLSHSATGLFSTWPHGTEGETTYSHITHGHRDDPELPLQAYVWTWSWPTSNLHLSTFLCWVWVDIFAICYYEWPHVLVMERP